VCHFSFRSSGSTMSKIKKEIEIRERHDKRWQLIRHTRLYRKLHKEYEGCLEQEDFATAYTIKSEISVGFGLMVSPPHPDQRSIYHIPRPFFPAVCVQGQDGGLYYVWRFLNENDEFPEGSMAIPQSPDKAGALLSNLLRHRTIPALEPDTLSPQHIINIEMNNIYDFIRRLKGAAGIPQKREPSSELIYEAFQALELYRAGKTDREIGELIWPKEYKRARRT